MDVRRRTEAEKRREKARNLRFKRPACKALNWGGIWNDLTDMQDAIGEVQWMAEDEEVLINALDGDEDEAFEFRIAFSDLQGECARMQEQMEELQRVQEAAFYSPASCDEDEPPVMFDLFFPAIRCDDLMGYDEYEGDYYDLDVFEAEMGGREARKKVMRLTKEQLMDLAGLCMRIARQYLALRYRYDCLEAAIDILKAQNDGVLKVVRQIEDLYEAAHEATDGFNRDMMYKSAVMDFDRALAELPERLWIE